MTYHSCQLGSSLKGKNLLWQTKVFPFRFSLFPNDLVCLKTNKSNSWPLWKWRHCRHCILPRYCMATELSNRNIKSKLPQNWTAWLQSGSSVFNAPVRWYMQKIKITKSAKECSSYWSEIKCGWSRVRTYGWTLDGITKCRKMLSFYTSVMFRLCLSYF